MKKIKVIQITTSTHSHLDGDANLDWRISNDWFSKEARILKKYYPNLEVECWTFEKGLKSEIVKEFDGIKFRIFPCSISLRHSMEVSFDLVRALQLEQVKVDSDSRLVLHLHEYHSWQSYFILRSVNSENVKVIAQHHGARSPFKNLMKYKKLFLGFPLIGAMQFAENKYFKKVDVFYALSDEEIDYLQERAPSSLIKFNPMGIDEEYFLKKSELILRRKLGFSSNKKYFTYVGHVKKNKGVGELIDAFKRLGDEFNLIVIGGGPDFEKYSNYVIALGLKNVKFIGPKYGEEKRDYVAASDGLILPSYTEGAPVVLMEAIALNTPVISTDVGGVRKMVEEGREGVLIGAKSHEEIIRGVKKLLSLEKKNIVDYAERYRWKNIIKKTYEDYLKC